MEESLKMLFKDRLYRFFDNELPPNCGIITKQLGKTMVEVAMQLCMEGSLDRSISDNQVHGLSTRTKPRLKTSTRLVRQVMCLLQNLTHPPP